MCSLKSNNSVPSIKSDQFWLHCHKFTIVTTADTKLSRIGVSVTNNNRFWIGWLDLWARLYKYNQLWQLTINDCLGLAAVPTGNPQRAVSCLRTDWFYLRRADPSPCCCCFL
jgi:hypothetical protein